MKRALAILLLVAACQTGHDVRILLGPTEDTLSLGFVCEDADGRPLIQRTAIGPGELQFAVVVDIITFGDQAPGCRGEELVTACEGGTCTVHTRQCHVVTLALSQTDTAATLLVKLREELADFTVTKNAPDEPVVLRVIAVDLAAPQTGDTCPADLDVPNDAVGCAYSCPVQLDDIDQVSVFLDTLDRRCEATMRLCAGFLD